MGRTIKNTVHFEPQTYINKATGEEIQAWTSAQEVPTDQNFSKVWLKQIVQRFDAISNIKTKVAYWLIDHMDRENRINLTQREIAKQSGFGIATVARTLTILQNEDFIRRQNGVVGYQVNPSCIFRGGHNKRMAICQEFYQTSKPEYRDKNERKYRLRAAIADLMKQLDEIEKEEEEERRQAAAEQAEEPQMQQAAEEPDETKHSQHE